MQVLRARTRPFNIVIARPAKNDELILCVCLDCAALIHGKGEDAAADSFSDC
jgi:hypothetical protein